MSLSSSQPLSTRSHSNRDPSTRPLYLRPWFILLVGAGGTLGTLARYLVSLVVPTVAQLPWPTLAVNIVGAFLLGVVLEGLTRRGHDEGRRRMLRLSIGTGFLGGFTTYSSLAVEAEQLVRAGRLWEGVGYGLTTVVIGLLATFAGMWVAVVHHRSTVRRAAAVRGASPGPASSEPASPGPAPSEPVS